MRGRDGKVFASCREKSTRLSPSSPGDIELFVLPARQESCVSDLEAFGMSRVGNPSGDDPADGPGPRVQHEGMILSIAQQALSQLQPQRFALRRWKARNVRTGRTLLPRKWCPVVIE